MRRKDIGVGLSLIAVLVLCCACAKPHPPATPIPTKSPEVTEGVSQTPVPTGTVLQTPTEEAEPTKEPQETVIPVPTETATPAPTEAPQETVTPIPTETVAPTPVITPEIEIEALVNHGWQSVNDLTETYCIVFPEVFTESFIEQTEGEVVFLYQSKEHPEIMLRIRFLFETDFDLLTDEIGENHAMQEIALGEKMGFSYRGERGDFLFDGCMVEHFYAAYVQETENGKPTGTLVVEFSYPKEQRDTYEAEQYRYYIIPIP